VVHLPTANLAVEKECELVVWRKNLRVGNHGEG